MYAALQSYSLGLLPRAVILLFSFFYLLCFYNKMYFQVINDLEEEIENWILKFADDSKIFSRIKTQTIT